ncbi:MAG: glycosyltransferase, partial [Oscillospiraceae bacterium]|nr:glycosyltransferase [Oscillospiraceae bacterium]
IRPYMKESWAIIHPSYHEGMSSVLMEGSAVGRPVIASDIPGCREIFDEMESGIGFAVRDREDLVRAITRFLDLPYEKKAAMGMAARKKMEAQFSREIVVQRYLDVITDPVR